MDLFPDTSNRIYINDKNKFQDLVQIFRNLYKDKVSTINIPNSISDYFIGDFSGLLINYLNIPHKYHAVLTILNGYKSSFDYDGKTTILLLDDEYINEALEFLQLEDNVENSETESIA